MMFSIYDELNGAPLLVAYQYKHDLARCSCTRYRPRGTLDQVVQARVEGKADVQDLLMEYCKMKKPL